MECLQDRDAGDTTSDCFGTESVSIFFLKGSRAADAGRAAAAAAAAVCNPSLRHLCRAAE